MGFPTHCFRNRLQTGGPHIATLVSRFRPILLALGILAFSALVTGGTPRALAGTTFIIVNSTADDEDAGGCQALAAGTDCTLREAITKANDTVDFQIKFAIPTTDPGFDSATGFYKIVATAGYIIDDTGTSAPTEIDGTTQPGFATTPIVWVDGSTLGSGSGFQVAGSGTVIRGLAVTGFPTAGILLNSDNNVIEGNFVGLSPDRHTAVPNAEGIVIVGRDGNRIGGTTVAQRNVISGNTGANVLAVEDLPDSPDENLVTGNFIGTNAGGLAAVGGREGVELDSGSDNVIGGVNTGEGNVISGNADNGIVLTSESDSTLIAGNMIGTDRLGAAAVPNAVGIEIFGAQNIVGALPAPTRNVISGNTSQQIVIIGADAHENIVQNNLLGPGANGERLGTSVSFPAVQILDARDNLIGDTRGAQFGNEIAYNMGNGVEVNGASATGNRILYNSIHTNGGRGIALAEGGNASQAAPQLTDANSADIDGTLTSTPNHSFSLQFFTNDACDDSGSGEGQTLIAIGNVDVDGDGTAEFTAQRFQGAAEGTIITATATDVTTHHTSPFSNCVVAVLDTTPTPEPTGSPTATPSETLTQGDIDCDGDIDLDDFDLLLEFAAELVSGNQLAPCPDVGEQEPISGFAWGDVNCDGFVNALDALYVLAHTVQIELPHAGCVAIGNQFT